MYEHRTRGTRSHHWLGRRRSPRRPAQSSYRLVGGAYGARFVIYSDRSARCGGCWVGCVLYPDRTKLPQVRRPYGSSCRRARLRSLRNLCPHHRVHAARLVDRVLTAKSHEDALRAPILSWMTHCPRQDAFVDPGASSGCLGLYARFGSGAGRNVQRGHILSVPSQLNRPARPP